MSEIRDIAVSILKYEFSHFHNVIFCAVPRACMLQNAIPDWISNAQLFFQFDYYVKLFEQISPDLTVGIRGR